jgi:replicative DNA helicase
VTSLELKQPPHSAEAEQSLLGALMLDNQAFEKVSWLAQDAFYSDRHRRLWHCLSRMIEAGRQADMVTVAAELGDDLDKAGGQAYLGALAQNTPSALNITRYAELVYEKSVQRQLALVGTAIAEEALAPGARDVRKMLDEAESKILAIGEHGTRSSDIVPIGKALAEYVDWIDEHPNGIETGLKDVDALTGGLLPGNLVVIAGRPHMGKTAYALQCAEHICATDQPGLVFSLESSRREIAGRLVEWHKHKAGRDAAVDRVFQLKLFIDDSSDIGPGLIRSKLRRMKKANGCALVIVDYLQLVRGKGDSREQEVAFVSRELKSIAKEFKVPVIALAQLNRDVEKRIDKRPHMADLRESGSIEADADLILLLYRPDYYERDCQTPVPEAEVIVAKNRNTGRTGSVKVMFAREIGRFGDFLPERYRTGVA